VRRIVLLAILLSGCSEAASSSQRAAGRTDPTEYKSLWKPEPDAPPKPAPKPRVEPPPDPAAEARRAEAARREAEDRRRRAQEREFNRLPSTVQRRVTLTADALAAKGLGGLTTAELAVIHGYAKQFPAVSPAELAEALAAYGDRKGARDHLAGLGVTDPDVMLRVRAAFGLESEATCKAARAVSEEIARFRLSGIGAEARAFVARHPDLFPVPAAATSAPKP
jgi:hypothetical protein